MTTAGDAVPTADDAVSTADDAVSTASSVVPTASNLTRISCRESQVESADLVDLLAHRCERGARFVDCIVPDQGGLPPVLVLASDQGYELVIVEDLPPLTDLQRFWPAVPFGDLLSPAPASAPGMSGPQDEGAVPLGDAGPICWRRLWLSVDVDGDRIRRVHAHRGQLHGGLEQLAVSHSYLGLPVLAEALNEHTPSTLALATVLAVEALLQIQPPVACQHARVFIAELERLGSHCGWLINQGAADEDAALVNEARQGREALARVFVAACGRRRATGIHFPGRIELNREAAAVELEGCLSALSDLISVARRSMCDRRSWRRRFQGKGIVEASLLEMGALSGPTARACGADDDLRRQHAYLTYDQLDFDVPVGEAGDLVDRCRVRLDEMVQSLDLVRQSLAAAQGPLAADDPRVVPPQTPTSIAGMIHHFELWMAGHGPQPESGTMAFAAIEGAEGELGVLLRSDGSSKPCVAHWRSASFYHFDLLSRVLSGQRLEDAKALVASLNLHVAEMDR